MPEFEAGDASLYPMCVDINGPAASRPRRPAGVLPGISKTDLMVPFPRVKAYCERCQARTAWQRTLALYAERIGVSADDIR